tara:strand:- start:217 stop:378 length:162 start_codon:yes stop_codon:yes gene_type:complete
VIDLDDLMERAYSDPAVLQYLYEAHYYQYEKVAKRIIKEHFARLSKEDEDGRG